MSLLEYTRQCDGCKKFIPCEMTYFTERMWFCEGCAQPESVEAATINWQGISKMIDCPVGDVKNVKLSNGKSSDIILLATKEELIDISRTIGLALSIGHAEAPLNERKIIVKVKK